MKMTKRERKAIYKRFFAGESVHDLLGDLLFIHYPDPVCRENIENILREGWQENWDSGLKWCKFDVWEDEE